MSSPDFRVPQYLQPVKKQQTTKREIINAVSVEINLKNTNLSDMLFWDAIYYLAETQGRQAGNNRIFEMTHDTIKSLTGLSKLQKQLNLACDFGLAELSESYELQEYEELLKDAQKKPQTLFKLGWWKTLLESQPDADAHGQDVTSQQFVRELPRKKPSRYVAAILNGCLFEPNRQYTQKSLLKLVKLPNSTKTPDLDDVERALQVLTRYGLLLSAGDALIFVKEVLRKSPADALRNAGHDWGVDEQYQQSLKIQPQIARYAVKLIQLSQFRLGKQFKNLFEALCGQNCPAGLWEANSRLRTSLEKRVRTMQVNDWGVIWKKFLLCDIKKQVWRANWEGETQIGLASIGALQFKPSDYAKLDKQESVRLRAWVRTPTARADEKLLLKLGNPHWAEIHILARHSQEQDFDLTDASNSIKWEEPIPLTLTSAIESKVQLCIEVSGSLQNTDVWQAG